MFKKLREKIVEEVRQSPIRFPGNDPFQSVSLDNSVKPENQGPKPEQFSITDDDGTSSELGSPYRGQNDMSSREQPGDKMAQTPDSTTHIQENDHFLFQYQASQQPVYIPQSDIESEVDDGQSSNLDGVSKEQLYLAAQKLHVRVQKYKIKYTEVVKAYKEMNDEKEKVKRALTDSQDRALRRMTELREQCSLEQQAKAHLEQNLRVILEEKDEMIGVLETKIQLLKEGNKAAESTSNIESSKEAVVDNLVDLGTSSPDSQAADLQEMQKKVKRLEELLGRCKETLSSNKERSTLLMQERNHLASQLEKKEKEILQVQEKELEVQARLRGELSEVREELKKMEKQQEESVMAMAETKQNMHQELETREQQLANIKQDLQILQDENDHLKKKVEEGVMEIDKVKDEQVRVINELQDKLKVTEVTLEEEKQSLMQELSRGKAAAIALVQQESAKKLETLEQEWKNKLREVEDAMATKNQQRLEETRNDCWQQLEKTEKKMQEMKVKEERLELELAEARDRYQREIEQTKLELQHHQLEVRNMKLKQQENMQRSEEEQHVINQIEMKLQTLVAEKDKELLLVTNSKDIMQQELTESHQKIVSLENDIRSMNDRYELLSSELSAAKSAAEEREAELRKKLADQENHLSKANKNLEEILIERDSLQENVNQLESSIQTYTETKTQLEVLSEKNAENVDRLQAESKQLSDTLVTVELELNALKEKNCELGDEVERLKYYEQVNEERETVHLKFRDEVNKKSEEIVELNGIISNLRDSHSKFFHERSTTLIENLSTLRNELVSTRTLGKKMKQDVEIEFSAIHRLVSELKREKDDLVGQIGTLENRSSEMTNELKAENESLKIHLETVAKEKDDYLETKLNHVQEKWHGHVEEIRLSLLKVTEEKFIDYEKYLNIFNKRTEELIAFKLDRLESLKDVVSQLKDKLHFSQTQKAAIIDQLNTRLQSQASEIGDLTGRIADMEAASGDLSTLLQERTKRESELKENHKIQLEKLKNKSQKLTEKLQQTREQLSTQKTDFERRMKELEKVQREKDEAHAVEISSSKETVCELGVLLKETEKQISDLESASLTSEQKFQAAEEECRKITDSSKSQESQKKDRIDHLEKAVEDLQTEILEKQQESEAISAQLLKEQGALRLLKEHLETIEASHRENEMMFNQRKEEWEIKLNSVLDEHSKQVKVLEESYHQKVSEAECLNLSSSKRLAELEAELVQKGLLLQELQELKNVSQQFTNEIQILKDELASKEKEIKDFCGTVTSKDTLLQSLSDQLEKLQVDLEDCGTLNAVCSRYKVDLQEQQAKIAELESNLKIQELTKDSEISALEQKLANMVEEFESSQIRVQQLEEVIANNSASQPAEDELESCEFRASELKSALSNFEKDYDQMKCEMEEQVAKLEERLKEALEQKKDFEDSVSSLKSNRSFLEEQMKEMCKNHNTVVEKLEEKLNLLNTQLDESLMVAEANQISSSQQLEDAKTQMEALQKDLSERVEQLLALQKANAQLKEENKKVSEENVRERQLPNNNVSVADSETDDETRKKQQETEDHLIWENNQIRTEMEKEVAEQRSALDEMQDLYQQQLKEKQEEIDRLKESEQIKTKKEVSDWDNGWDEEPVEDELCAVPSNGPEKENKRLTIEEMQESVTKYQKEVEDLRRLLKLTDGRPSITELNNGGQNHHDTSLQPTEYEYLRNIMLEYMMGKEPLTLAKVISAVLRFTDDQTQQILMREEAKQTSVK